jgi:hypothetical protein
MKIHHRQIDPTCSMPGIWSTETDDQAMRRAPDFARAFFSHLNSEFPDLYRALVFLRCSTQPDDIFALVDQSPGGLLVQIDPDLGYIVVKNDAGQGEYGDWGAGFDRVAEALKQIRLGGSR